MTPYSELAAELAQRKVNEYVPPAIPSVRQQPVEIPGVMYQTRELFQPVVSQPNKDNK
jgi:hypothetical protein